MKRFAAIDVLRGFVMVLMAMDHASEVFNRSRFFSDSVRMWTPGTAIPAAQFLLRWMTHLCAPTFVALAGTALAISVERGRSSRHILIRAGVIFVLEVGWMSWAFLDGFGQLLFQVLYAISASLVCMAFLRRLSDRALLAVGLFLALGCELLIGIADALHVLGTLPVAVILSGGMFPPRLYVGYALLPWLSLMCLGWVFGRWLLRSQDSPANGSPVRLLLVVSAIAFGTFVLLRGLNGYGNMRLLRDSAAPLQWLHVSKYPPSATYIGLELGIASLLLALVWKVADAPVFAWFKLLGQTALFFYILHLHTLKLAAFLFGGEHAYGVGASVLGGLGVVLFLTPLCFVYRRYKRAHPQSVAQWI